MLRSALDRASVAQEYVAGLAERTGDEELAGRAGEMQQDKIDAVVAERIAERAMQPDRGLDLDDGMEL